MLLVSDANIFMDFAAAEILPLLFRLGDELIVPDILYAQELASRHALLLELGLRLQPMTGEQVDRAIALMARYREPSTNDLLALTLAVDLRCPLLSGDRRLRDAALREGVEVRGTLYLVECMVKSRHLTVDAAENAYAAMKHAGRRLPWDHVRMQLAQLR